MFPAVEKARPYLSMLMGQSGYRALLARAQALAARETGWLAALEIGPQGQIERRPDGAARDAAALAEAEVLLLTHLVGLLIAFIGPALTLRLLRQVWPLVPIDDADFTLSDDDEDAQ